VGIAAPLASRTRNLLLHPLHLHVYLY
jgi:hypothetical protein